MVSLVFMRKVTRPAWLISRLGGGAIGTNDSDNTVSTNPCRPPADGNVALLGAEGGIGN